MESEVGQQATKPINGNVNNGADGSKPKPSDATRSSPQQQARPPWAVNADTGGRPLFSDDEAGQSERSDVSGAGSDRGGQDRVSSPPYWLAAHSRTTTNHSVESVLPLGAITLQDNERDSEDDPAPGATYGRDRNRACWAKSVQVTNYVVVNGSATNIGAFVVWNIRVETLNGSYMNIRKRYSEFDDFRHQLVQTFPSFEAAVPVLPPKSVIAKFRPGFLEKRRSGLQYFLNCILLNPEFSGSPVLKDFLFC